MVSLCIFVCWNSSFFVCRYRLVKISYGSGLRSQSSCSLQGESVFNCLSQGHRHGHCSQRASNRRPFDHRFDALTDRAIVADRNLSRL